MINNISKQKITNYLSLLKREGIVISNEQERKLEEINHRATSNWLIFNSLSLKQIEDERGIENSYAGDINVINRIFDFNIEINHPDSPEKYFQVIFEEEPTGEMVGDKDHQQPVLRKAGFRGIEPINNDFFVALNRQLREAGDEATIPRGEDGNFTYRVVGVPINNAGNQVWTDEEPYYLEDEKGEIIGKATQPDGKETGFWPYFKLLNTSNNTLIRFPQRMERVPTDSFGIEHEEFEELIKECVENSDDFEDGGHRLQFKGDKNSWPKPDTREWIAVRKDLIEVGYTAYITSIYEDGEKNWKKRTSLADLLNIPEIRDSITGDNNNRQPELVSVEQIEEFNDLLLNLEFSTNYREFYGKILGNGSERQRKLQEIDEVLFIKIRNKVNDLKDLRKLVLGDTEEIKNDKEKFRDEEIKKRVKLVELMRELLKKEKDKQNPDNNHEDDKQEDEQISELEKAKFVAIQRIRQELTKEPEITEQELEKDKRRWRVLINSSNEIEKINDIREKLLAYIFEKRKEKISKKKIAELIERAEKTGDYEELKGLIGKIEGFRGSPDYLSLKDRIKNLKVKLANNDLQSYQETNVKMVEEELLKCGVKIGEVKQEAQKAFDKLNTVKSLSAEEIDNQKEIISISVKTKSAEKRLDRLIEKFDNSHDKIAKKQVKRKILQFVSDKNIFSQKAVEMRKEKLDLILGNYTQEVKPSPSFPRTMVISVFLFIVFLIGIKIYWKRKRRRSY